MPHGSACIARYAVIRGSEPAGSPGSGEVRVTAGRRVGVGLGSAADAVVAVKAVFLGRLQVTIGVHAGRVLDLVLGVRDNNVIPFQAGPLQRDERFGRTEEAGLDGDPRRLTVSVIGVHLSDRTDLVPV